MYKKKQLSLKQLFKTIITLVIIFYVVKALLNFFGFNNNSSNNINTYEQNHNVVHVEDTSSEDVDYQTPIGVRSKYTKIKGNNDDDVTIMIYMIGSDLESTYGMATDDINEMLYNEIQGNINIIIQTGGCTSWQNSTISDKKNQIYTINANGFMKLQDNVGNGPMNEEKSLSDFIKYSASNFPANRYMLILWDHGGGSVTGYGYDERYPNHQSLSPDLLAKALKNGGVKFDILGFDACLMANIETAIACEPYADYLLASEESEPGEGWDYKNWIRLIDDNTSISSLNLGKQIIDDYITSCKKGSRNSEATLSLIDLGELVYNINEPFNAFSLAINNALNNEKYQSIATARYNTKEFSKSSYLDQVDLVDLATKFNLNGSKELASGIKAAVKYNKTNNIYDAYGLSAYFPYANLSKLNSIIEIDTTIGLEKEYVGAVKNFASYLASGQIVAQNSNATSSSIFGTLFDDDYYYPDEDYYTSGNLFDILTDSYYDDSYYGYGDWTDSLLLDGLSYFFRNNSLDLKQLEYKNKNDKLVVSLSEDNWQLIDSILLNVFVDDGEGYLDLGKDNVFEFDEDYDLIIDYDGTWMSINEHVVSYQTISDEYIDESNYKIVGKIPALLNDERVDVVVNFTDEDPYGVILGARKLYDENDILQKGLIPIKENDVIKFLCNYYSYDGELIDEYQIGDDLVVQGELQIDNIYLDNKYVYAYCLKDIYGNNFYTKAIKN